MGRNHVNDRLKQERIGEVNYNSHGQRMEIIAYNNDSDVTILFEDGTIREHVYYSCFKQGIAKNFEAPEVYGVGVTGTKQKKINGKLTKEYSTWTNMLQRCYNPQKWEKFPNYKECSICNEWLKYDNFYEWCHNQRNWNKVIENPCQFHIDKDIILKGNHIYSPDYCSFVPANVNILFVKRERSRGEYPIGVSKHPSGKYKATCSLKVLNKGIALSYYDTVEEAFLFYKQNKEYLIKEVAKREYEKGNITKKCYEAMMNYKVEITD